MSNFTLENFMLYTGITQKHPEIFNSGKKKEIDNFVGFFKKYTEMANEKKSSGLKVIDEIKKDFKMDESESEKLENTDWNAKFFAFCSSDSSNDVYVYPKNNGGEKLHLPHKFYVNCIKLRNAIPDSIVIVNRNKHMMIAGTSKNDDNELGSEIHFKVILIHNKKLNKWVVSPYKIVSQVVDKKQCYTFAMSASSDSVERQYQVWEKGVELLKDNLGILNLKYYDEHFKSFPNLFSKEQNDRLMSEVHNLVSDIPYTPSDKKPADTASDKKPSDTAPGKKPAKSASVKKPSVKKPSAKKSASAKKPAKKPSKKGGKTRSKKKK